MEGFNQAKEIAVLCCSQSSEYKNIPDLDLYDVKRDALTFDGSSPIVAHPPCRSWSAFLSHLAKPEPGERDLAHFCIEKLKSNGGVLEHPAHSKLFTDGYLPLPGQPVDDLKTIEVSQFWFGYPLRKRTWLCFSKVDLALVQTPFKLFPQAGSGQIQQFDNMSNKQKSYSTFEFCNFLVDSARLVSC